MTVILAVIMKGSSLSSDKVDDSNLLKPNEHANKHNSTRHHKNHHHHHNDTRNHKKRHRCLILVFFSSFIHKNI